MSSLQQCYNGNGLYACRFIKTDFIFKGTWTLPTGQENDIDFRGRYETDQEACDAICSRITAILQAQYDADTAPDSIGLTGRLVQIKTNKINAWDIYYTGTII